MQKIVIHGFGWAIILPLAILADLTQIILDFVAVGLIINRVIEVLMICVLALWLLVGNVFSARPWLLLVASVIGETIPVIDAAPLWSLDVWYILKTVGKEDRTAQEV